jgi:lactate dehydrogenase-like 2-hydroxyacid dehydrogenase
MHGEIVGADTRDLLYSYFTDSNDLYVIWSDLGRQYKRRMIEYERGKLLAIVSPTTGLDHIDVAACKEFGVDVLSL